RRSEMLCVEGFKLGSRTRFAFDQSTSSALSCASQNLRSCASDLNCGTLVFAFIDLSFLARQGWRRGGALWRYANGGRVRQTTPTGSCGPAAGNIVVDTRGLQQDFDVPARAGPCS